MQHRLSTYFEGGNDGDRTERNSVTFLQHLSSSREFRCNFIANTLQNLHQALVGEGEGRRDAWWQLAQRLQGLEHVQAFFASIEQHPVAALLLRIDDKSHMRNMP